MTAKDFHLTTEQLSAYLDNALSPQERASAEDHLQTCAHCQQILTGLRQTVALLHALPQPALPRSFLLSQEMVAETTPETQQEYGGHVLPFAPPRRRAKPGYLSNTMRFMSVIAALIGIFLLGTSLFSTLPRALPTAGSASSSSNSSGMSPLTPTKEAGQSSAGTGSMTPGISHVVTPNETKPETIIPKPSQPTASPFQPLLSFFDLTKPQGQAIVGLLLVVLGIIGLLAVRWRRQKMQV